MSADSKRRTMSMKGKAGKSILALLLVMLFVFFVYKPPVMAEDIPEGETVSEETSSGLAVSSEAPGEDTGHDLEARRILWHTGRGRHAQDH